jgi:hypothetical protein
LGSSFAFRAGASCFAAAAGRFAAPIASISICES